MASKGILAKCVDGSHCRGAPFFFFVCWIGPKSVRFRDGGRARMKWMRNEELRYEERRQWRN